MLRLVLPFVHGGQGEALATTCHEFWHAYLPGRRSRIRAVRKVAMLAIRWKLRVRMWVEQCCARWIRGRFHPDRNTLEQLEKFAIRVILKLCPFVHDGPKEGIQIQ